MFQQSWNNIIGVYRAQFRRMYTVQGVLPILNDQIILRLIREYNRPGGSDDVALQVWLDAVDNYEAQTQWEVRHIIIALQLRDRGLKSASTTSPQFFTLVLQSSSY